jgi:hypothetical protein
MHQHHYDPARSVQRFQVGNSILMGGGTVLVRINNPIVIYCRS